MTDNPAYELTQLIDAQAHDYDCDCEECDGDTNVPVGPVAQLHMQMLRPHLESERDTARKGNRLPVVRQAKHKGKA